jgi:hypothetical protein
VSDTAASVVLAVDIFCIIVAVKVLIRLIALLRRLSPSPAVDARRGCTRDDRIPFGFILRLMDHRTGTPDQTDRAA